MSATSLRPCKRCADLGAPCYYHDWTLGFTGPQVCRASGITYRQLDYWARTDLLRPARNHAPGSGGQRRYSIGDVRFACLLRRCLDAGLSLQQLRASMEPLRDADNVGWLVLGQRGSGVAADIEELAEHLTDAGDYCFVVDLDVDVPDPRIAPGQHAPSAKPDMTGAMSGHELEPKNRERFETRGDKALTREEVMRARG